MIRVFKNFRKDEDGAVTVDWVVLTAAVVALAGAAYVAIEDGAVNLTESTQQAIENLAPEAGGGDGGGGGGDGG
ncbi:hypothetical protein [Sedimentitalea todarodis]|uniref:Pilus assembly protein n=1 Tax=Sedimentitalea todarodis TaxID=1631240 RepID=A0ABU3V9L6_9RHOB|nr:hypothetical protein [Sedimentitalea todarodis]MDU9002474.1 hypothetical protein [Sedimentitalea todarodis]